MAGAVTDLSGLAACNTLLAGAESDVKRWREANKRQDVKSGPFSQAEKDTLRQAVVEYAGGHVLRWVGEEVALQGEVLGAQTVDRTGGDMLAGKFPFGECFLKCVLFLLG